MSLTDGPMGQGEWILFVEDESSVREITSRALRYCGYYVFEADSVREATDIFKREEGNFQLIFTDLMLPDGTGLDLLEAVLTQEPGVPALVATGSGPGEEFYQELREKGHGFIAKPYLLEELLAEVRTVIDGAATHAPQVAAR